MKARFGISLLALTIIGITPGCIATKEIPKEAFLEVYAGTWLNPDNEGEYYSWQKIITYRDGTLESYKKLGDSTPVFTIYGQSMKFTETTVNRRGDVWYRSTWISIGTICYEIGKISGNGDVFERMVSVGKPIERWSPGMAASSSAIHYFKFYRQSE